MDERFSGQAIKVRPPRRFDVTPEIPGSKSLTNRALLLAALAADDSHLHGWLDAEDTQLMKSALADIGAIDLGPGAALTVHGFAGPLRWTDEPNFYVGTAGTVARFLLAALAGGEGRAYLDGSPRMRERPMASLIAALRQQGASIRCLSSPDALPVCVGPHRARLRGGEIRIDRPPSSQFVSALVFAGLLADSPLSIILTQGTPARPYVDMTVAVARAFGARAEWLDADRLHVVPGGLRGCTYQIEPDASAASYFFALAAIYGGTIAVTNLGHASLQGDARFPQILATMGASVQQTADRTIVRGGTRLSGGDFDLGDMPDMTLTLAVVALFASGTTRISGVGILRHHESDRLEAVACELRKLGATVDVEPDAITVVPPAGGPRRDVVVETYRDHRMAMAFSLAGEVEILDPGCVTKTFPRYFNEIGQLGMVAGFNP